MTNVQLRDALAAELAELHGITGKNKKDIRRQIGQVLGLYWFPSHSAWLALDDHAGLAATAKRPTDPNWRKRPSNNPTAWAARQTDTRTRRKEVAQSLGYPNSGALLAAITQAGEETRQQIRQLLTMS